MIQTFQGHIIVLLNSSDQLSYQSENSSDFTSSSHMKSSDRYISYTIHEMDDLSQECLRVISLMNDISRYNHNECVLLESSVIDNESITKDGATEFDAIDNLTSYPDDIHCRRSNRFNVNRSDCLVVQMMMLMMNWNKMIPMIFFR